MKTTSIRVRLKTDLTKCNGALVLGAEGYTPMEKATARYQGLAAWLTT